MGSSQVHVARSLPLCVPSLCLLWSMKKGHQPVTKYTSRPGPTEEFLQRLGTQIETGYLFSIFTPVFPQAPASPN